MTASLERLAAIAAQDPALGVQDRLQAFGIVLHGVPSARPVTGSGITSKAVADRTKRSISEAELETALGEGAETLMRQRSRPSSVSSASGSRRASVVSGVRVQTVQLVLDIA